MAGGAQRTDGCPQITLRGRNSVNGNSNPVIYVDGNRTGNTCIALPTIP